MGKWRLGIDLGTNSIGVAALRLEDSANGRRISGLLDMGVRIFSDGRNPKDKQSLAAMRRGPRAMRRNRDRGLNRDARYLRELQSAGLMPVQSDPPTEAESETRRALESLDPYVLRARGLDEKLSPFEIGRALFHLKRRGFKSNRKTDGGDEENGKIREAASRTRQLLAEANCRTLGEWLGRARIERLRENEELPAGSRLPLPQARTRLHGSGANAFYDFYPTREMILEEFDLLWRAQKRWHADLLTDKAHAMLRETLSWQWPLKAQPVGKCRLDPTQERAPRALPTVQRLRIYQDLNHLSVQRPGEPARILTRKERDLLAAKALSQSKIEFDRMRGWLKLPPDARFNIESEKRRHLDGDLTAAKLAGKKFWGPDWRALPLETQDCIVSRLLEQEDEKALVAWLTETYGLPEDRATAVSRAALPAGHGAFCWEVSAKLRDALEADVITYDTAVTNAGYASHSDSDDGEIFDRALPYYGKVLEHHVAFGSGNPNDAEEKRYGKIANPTVHVALNQLRRVVNDLMHRFGTPSEIIVELARELPLSAQGQRDLERRQRENQAANDARRAILAEQKQPDSYDNRMRLRLWEELNPTDPLDRRCVFTGEQISVARLFSDEVEIEHLLPWSRTLDDGAANKTVSLRRANRAKGRQTPYEAFAHSPAGYDWQAIADRAANLPANKSWRFGPDAMERYENGERDFLARQLTDTQYMARLAFSYLKKTGADVWVTPGRMTADLRHALGLDSILPGHNSEERASPAKNRLDHRHHAIDALVVALTDRGLLQRVATLAAHRETEGRSRLLPKLDEPWPEFRSDVVDCLDSLVVSHKPDHGVQGVLHNETAYGLMDDAPDTKGVREVVHRVPLNGFRKRSDLERIRDELLRRHFIAETEGVADKELGKALEKIGAEMTPPVRKVRIVERLNVIPIADRSGHAYKGYKGDANYCYDVFEGKGGKWTGRVVSRFDANQPGFEPNARTSTEGEALVMRLRVNDMLELDENGQREIMRVVKLSEGRITMAGHSAAGSLKTRDADTNDPFRYVTVSPSGLQTRGALSVRVSPSGRIRHKGNLT